jgi:hypothetical protein
MISSLEMVKFLLDNGADPDVFDGRCLEDACNRGTYLFSLSILAKVQKLTRDFLEEMGLIRILLEGKADPNAGLLRAIRRRNVEMSRLLVEYGAKPGPMHATSLKYVSKKKQREMGLL